MGKAEKTVDRVGLAQKGVPEKKRDNLFITSPTDLFLSWPRLRWVDHGGEVLRSLFQE
jgi:hypothetical protein